MIWNKEEVNEMQTQKIRKNHMDVLWHEYTDKEGQNLPIVQASLTEKASIIGRAGIMLLSCGTGAWRVRSSMNTLAEVMGVTCTADIGLMSIEYTCFDGQDGFTQSLCLTNTGVNTSKLNRLEHFIQDFETEGKDMSGEQLHNLLDNIEDPHNLGAIIRTANLAGAHGVIIPKHRAVGLTATVAKTSAGALNYTPVAKVANLGQTIDELKEKGIWFVCADMDGEVMYRQNLTGPIGLVIGNEGNGVSRLVKEKCDFTTAIPMKGDIDSLNASVAAGVLAFEIVRQRLSK